MEYTDDAKKYLLPLSFLWKSSSNIRERIFHLIWIISCKKWRPFSALQKSFLQRYFDGNFKLQHFKLSWFKTTTCPTTMVYDLGLQLVLVATSSPIKGWSISILSIRFENILPQSEAKLPNQNLIIPLNVHNIGNSKSWLIFKKPVPHRHFC